MSVMSNKQPSSERPIGVYLVALYFVLAGFLESIQKYQEWNAPLSFKPWAEHSVWALTAHTMVYLALALLVWNFASLGRLGALVYGYAHLTMYVVLASIYVLYEGATPLTITPLSVSIAIFHVSALIPVVAYLQPKRQKKLFRVSLLDMFLSSD
ncbi:MAG: hypothetical protein BMS9Abin37_0940 [Acidobacteriota bacterium]|nr:MAG: hypothetical protein BMS9Abin37_0940 [Acidobacteriota bacterium]